MNCAVIIRSWGTLCEEDLRDDFRVMYLKILTEQKERIQGRVKLELEGDDYLVAILEIEIKMMVVEIEEEEKKGKESVGGDDEVAGVVNTAGDDGDTGEQETEEGEEEAQIDSVSTCAGDEGVGDKEGPTAYEMETRGDDHNSKVGGADIQGSGKVEFLSKQLDSENKDGRPNIITSRRSYLECVLGPLEKGSIRPLKELIGDARPESPILTKPDYVSVEGAGSGYHNSVITHDGEALTNTLPNAIAEVESVETIPSSESETAAEGKTVGPAVGVLSSDPSREEGISSREEE